MKQDLLNPEWWFTVVIVAIFVAIIGHFAYKYLDKFLTKRSIKIKARNQESQMVEEEMLKYYVSDYNLLVIRNLSNISNYLIAILVFCFVILFVSYATFISSHPENPLAFFLVFASLLLFLLMFYFILRKNGTEQMRIRKASISYIEHNTIGKYFPGKWLLTYHKGDGIKNSEKVEIKDGNKYYVNGAFKFIILNFQVNVDTKQITFEKHTLNGIFSKETLDVENPVKIVGRSTSTAVLLYERI